MPKDLKNFHPFLLSVLVMLGLTSAPQAARARTVRTRTPVAESLSGRVHDAAGQPIAGADVALEELDRAVITGEDGNFRFANVPDGRYTLQVRRPGYAPVAREIVLPGAASIDITLTENPFPLEALTVTASRTPLDPENSPLPATSLGRERLDRATSVSLSHTLEKLAGVRTLSTGAEIGKPIIRGLSGSRVLVLENGMRLEDYSWSQEDAPSIDAQLADRVELIRGPASVLYGSDAIGGVVNVIPEALPDASGQDPFTRGTVTAYGASNNREVGGEVGLEGASGSTGWRVKGIGRFAEALHTPQGELENTGFLALTGEAALARRGSWGSLTGRYSRYGGEFKLLEEGGPPPGVEEGEEGGPERKLSDDRMQVLGRFPMGSALVETRAQVQRHWLSELADAAEIPGEADAGEADGGMTEVTIFDLTLLTGQLEVLTHLAPMGPFKATLGASGTLQSSSTAGAVPLIPEASNKSGAVFALGQLMQGPFSFLAGVRADVKSMSPDPDPDRGIPDADRAWSALTYNVGAVAALGRGLSLSANVGSAWRAPNLFELYAEGPRLGEARYEFGDGTLDEEKSLNVDGGLKLETDRVQARAALFRNDIQDYIFIAPTGQSIGGLQVYEYTQADAHLQGFELSAEARVLPAFILRGRYDRVEGTNDETDSPLPLIPPDRADVGAEWRAGIPARPRYVSVDVEWAGEQDRLAEFDIATDSYTLLNIGAGMTTTVAGRDLTLDLQVKNLGNVEYRDFLSRYKAFALNPGRNIKLKLSTTF